MQLGLVSEHFPKISRVRGKWVGASPTTGIMKSIRHKREQRKPKGTQPGSRKGQIRQGVFEKIKQAREEGHAWLSHPAPKCGNFTYEKGMFRLKIEPPSEDDNIPKYLVRDVCWAFLRCKTDGIGLFEIHDYKGERLVAWVGGQAGYRTITENDILAIVVEQHAHPTAS